ncbi:MAG: hypothetical protein NTV79_08965 [Candidatus Aureabacteria bacterium]|nr:hypothetical protein [Candidatus Auribacterota bacterium]
MRGVLQGAGEIKAGVGLPYLWFCGEVEIAYSSFLRWRSREKKALPLLLAPGPKKVEPLQVENLHLEIAGLKHRKKLSYGTGELSRRFQDQISRRDFQELVKTIREEINLERWLKMRHVTWHIPNLAWCMDDLQVEFRDEEDEKLYGNRFQDLASRYKFGPLAGDFPCGEETAGHLETLFNRFDAPLILKRDNRGNLNHPMVNEVLNECLVIPLNSPKHYAPYNGSIEKSQGEFQGVFWEKLPLEFRKTPENPTPKFPRKHFQTYAETVENDLNHRPRPSLGGKNSCQVYFEGKNKHRFSKRERREIYDWTIWLAGDILDGTGGNDSLTYETAWRIAIEIWLEIKGFITVVTNGKVSPNYFSQNAH